MTAIFQDVRYAFRQMRKNAAFTAMALAILGLGIGANTAIFTVVNALLLKVLPVRDPQQLVIVGDPNLPNNRSNGTPRTDLFSYPLYKEFRDQNSVFSGLSAAGTEHRVEVETAEGAISDERAVGRMVSGNYFSVLGLSAAAGRLLNSTDDSAENANPVAVLAYSYWQRKYALSPSVVGRQIHLNGYAFTIVGVAPLGFEGDVPGDPIQLFVPIAMQPEIVRGRHWLTTPNTSWLTLMGRLRPGVNAAQAEANINLLFKQALAGEYGASLSQEDRNALQDNPPVRVSPGSSGFSDLRGDYRTPLLLLMGIVGLVLLIACVNVANLMLARAAARGREIAIRMAIGAHRHRILQQLLTESMVLALLGGLVGLLLATWGVRFLVRAVESDLHNLPLLPDARVLAFTAVASLLTGIFFGLAPALRTLQVQVTPALKESGRGAAGKSTGVEWGKALVAGQVALSLLVLFAAGLLVRSLQKLMTQDFGYERDHLITARLDPAAAGYKKEKMQTLAQQLTERIAGTPGVRAVAYSKNGLFSGSETDDAIRVPGFDSADVKQRFSYEDYVGPDYFGAVGIPILAGRGIAAQDTAASLRVAVVNQALAQHFFQGQNPIGRQFIIDDPDWLDKAITIVGLSQNAQDHGSALSESEPRPKFYLAFQQMPDPNQIILEVRVGGPPTAALNNVRGQIKAVESRLPIQFIKTVDQLVYDSASNRIALARLSAGFAGLALLLACVGLYGVMSYKVAGRTREIGVRMALGARRQDVLQLVLRETLALAVAGVLIGIPLALAGGRVLRSFLFGLKSTDPLSLGSVILLLTLVSALAGLIPARRASQVEPMKALRYE